nr:hypothetical protein [Tanacetum cinerariifolium]
MHPRIPKGNDGLFFLLPTREQIIVAQNARFLENTLITQKASKSLEDLEINQEEDRHPSIDTSLNHEENDQEIDEPQSDINTVRESTRTRCLTNRMCLYIDGKPTNYEAKLLDPKSDKWMNAMNVEMQSMKDTKFETWLNFLLTAKPLVASGSSRRRPTWMKLYIPIKLRYHMENSKRGSIPMQEKIGLSKSQGASTPAELKRMQNVPYASAVGSIMYAVRCTRPDVTNTKDKFLVYGGDIKQELRVSCYTDARYLIDADDLKSQIG